MANRIATSIVCAIVLSGCALALPPPVVSTRQTARSPAADERGVAASCGTPGRERCGPEPTPDPSLIRKQALACAEDCGKQWMESSGVAATAERPLEKKLSSLRSVEGRLLSCFVMCEQRATQTVNLSMPPGVEPCTESGPAPQDSTCLQYSCERYGAQKLMLPVGVRAGERCEVIGQGVAGSCVGGLCVSEPNKAAACSASAIRATAVQWVHVTQEVLEQCHREGATISCDLAVLAPNFRSYLIDMLRCAPNPLWPDRLPTLPWGHWPIALPTPRGEKTR